MRIGLRTMLLAGSVVIAAMLLFEDINNTHATYAQTKQEASTAEVKIDNFSFGPAVTKISAGTTVTWINRDDIPHTVASTDKAFKSKVMDTDEKFSYTFSKAGTYPYFCSIHPKMTGTVEVQ
jgi:plastocyanin